MFKVVEVLNIQSNVPSKHPTAFDARVTGTSKTFNYDRFRAPPGTVIFFAEILPVGCDTLIMRPRWFAPSELPQNATKRPIYYSVVQPQNNPETVLKVVLMPVQSRGIP